MLAIILSLKFFSPALAEDIYTTTMPDGTIVFTDSPPNTNFVIFDVDGPPPERKHVTRKNFPSMNKYDGLIQQAAQKYYVSGAR